MFSLISGLNKGISNCSIKTAVNKLFDMKSRGGLIHTNHHFFNLISFTEQCFAKHACNINVFDLTVDEILENCNFTFPCQKHGADILLYAIFYYIRLRMR